MFDAERWAKLKLEDAGGKGSGHSDSSCGSGVWKGIKKRASKTNRGPSL